jgi:hypothetical protein
MGVVYRATQLALERPVALKVIAPEFASDADFRARFKRESLTAAAIEHPNVLPVYDARDEDGVLFLTMRYVEGTDLREALAHEGRLEPHRAAQIVRLVGSALDAAHEVGLVHRDVKPANILLAHRRGEEQVYLTDFGLTKQIRAEGGMTRTGMFVGTLDYVAPEQLRGEPVDARTDIYSLGCVLYQALTGRVPYPRDSDVAKMFAHASEPPPSVRAVAPELPYAFDQVIGKAMAKDPIHRYLSAGDLGLAALAAARGAAVTRAERTVAQGEAAPHGPVAVVPPPTPPTWVPPPVAAATYPEAAAPVGPYSEAPRAPHRRKPRLGLILGGVAALLLAVVAVVLATSSGGGGHHQQPPPTDSEAYREAQLSAAEKFATDLHSQYTPGVIVGGPTCKPLNLIDTASVPVGGSFDCSFDISSRFAAGAGTMHDLLRVTSANPIGIGFANCYFQPRNGKREGCP